MQYYPEASSDRKVNVSALAPLTNYAEMNLCIHDLSVVNELVSGLLFKGSVMRGMAPGYSTMTNNITLLTYCATKTVPNEKNSH